MHAGGAYLVKAGLSDRDGLVERIRRDVRTVGKFTCARAAAGRCSAVAERKI